MNKSEKTKQYIIEQAAPIFNKNGYAGTSLSQITEVTGLTKGAVYGNFENKEDIAFEALKYNFEQISNEIAQKIKEHENYCDRLEAYAKFYYKNYDRLSKMGGCPLQNAATENDDGNPVLKKLVLNLIRHWESSIEKIIKKGIKEGEIKREIKIKEFASLFIGMIEGGIMLSKVTGNKKHLKYSVEHLINIINNYRL